jgi:hypothetical protein
MFGIVHTVLHRTLYIITHYNCLHCNQRIQRKILSLIFSTLVVIFFVYNLLAILVLLLLYLLLAHSILSRLKVTNRAFHHYAPLLLNRMPATLHWRLLMILVVFFISLLFSCNFFVWLGSRVNENANPWITDTVVSGRYCLRCAHF